MVEVTAGRGRIGVYQVRVCADIVPWAVGFGGPPDKLVSLAPGHAGADHLLRQASYGVKTLGSPGEAMRPARDIASSLPCLSH